MLKFWATTKVRDVFFESQIHSLSYIHCAISILGETEKNVRILRDGTNSLVLPVVQLEGRAGGRETTRRIRGCRPGILKVRVSMATAGTGCLHNTDDFYA